MKEKWVIAAKRADFQEIGRAFSIDPVIARVIRNRDIVGEAEIDYYLHGTLAQLSGPEEMKDMEKTCAILREKVASGRRIRIIGDYDIDGVTSTYILKRGLTALGGRADTCLPDRVADGYGLNERLIRQAYADGVDTILTCDNGISAYEEVALARELGMTVLITDHHEVPTEEREGEEVPKIPPANGVVNPKRPDCPYPFKQLCGAAVAFQLIRCLYKEEKETEAFEEILEELLEMAAVATVGDVMDLVGENRILVKEGLKRLQHSKNMGLRALIEACGLKDRILTAYHIGFVLGPCINASGRLDTARRALELLEAGEEREAARLAGDLTAMNESRKALTEEGVREAAALVESGPQKEDRVLVIYLPNCHESLAGIIAGRLRERYYRPVLVLTRGENGVKGSGRSIEGYHMFRELCACQDLLVKFGGHPMAAGLSMEEGRVEELRLRLNANCTLKEEELTPKLTIDVPMPMAYVTEALVEQLSLLEPFGKANTKPVFAQKGISLLDCRVLGKNRNVVKMKLQDQEGNLREGIYFGEPEALLERAKEGRPMSVAYYPDINEYQGRRSLQFVIRNFC